MKQPSLAEAGRFIAIVFAALALQFVARIVLFDGSAEQLSGINIVAAIAVGVILMGGWLGRGGKNA